MLRTSGTFWTCLSCTLTNCRDDKTCIVCGASNSANTGIESRISSAATSSSSEFNPKCKLCTFVNARSDSICQMCQMTLEIVVTKKIADYDDDVCVVLETSSSSTNSKFKAAKDKKIGTDTDSSDSGSEVSTACCYDVVAEHFYEFADAEQDAETSAVTFRCKVHGKTFRTRPMMTAYIVKTFKEKLLNMAAEQNRNSRKKVAAKEVLVRESANINDQSIKSGGKRPTFSSVMSDEEIALQMAMEDYEDLVGQSDESSYAANDFYSAGSSSSSSSSSGRKHQDSRIKHSSSSTVHRQKFTISQPSSARNPDQIMHRGVMNNERRTPSAKNKKRKKTSFDSDSDSEDEVIEQVEMIEEACSSTPKENLMGISRELRLQKLLSRIDRIVLRLNTQMEAVSRNSRSGHDDDIAKKGKSSTSSLSGSDSAQDVAPKGVKIISHTDTLESSIQANAAPSATAVSVSESMLIGSLSGLRSYQTKGVEWLSSLHVSGLNGILADEMGLGTLQYSTVQYST